MSEGYIFSFVIFSYFPTSLNKHVFKTKETIKKSFQENLEKMLWIYLNDPFVLFSTTVLHDNKAPLRF